MIFNLEPCKRDKRGRNVTDYAVRDHYEKLAEELFEAHEAAIVNDPNAEAIELLHVMTVCSTRIRNLGLSDEHLAELQQFVIEHNRERGYFEEAGNDNRT